MMLSDVDDVMCLCICVKWVELLPCIYYNCMCQPWVVNDVWEVML